MHLPPSGTFPPRSRIQSPGRSNPNKHWGFWAGEPHQEGESVACGPAPVEERTTKALSNSEKLARKLQRMAARGVEPSPHLDRMLEEMAQAKWREQHRADRYIPRRPGGWQHEDEDLWQIQRRLRGEMFYKSEMDCSDTDGSEFAPSQRPLQLLDFLAGFPIVDLYPASSCDNSDAEWIVVPSESSGAEVEEQYVLIEDQPPTLTPSQESSGSGPGLCA